MNFEKVTKIGLAVALATSPVVTNAGVASSKEALDACAMAIVENLAAEQGSPMAYNLDPASMGNKADLKRREVIHLDVRNPDSDEIVARADCVIDNRANVKKLINVPLDAPDARMRASQVK